MTGRRKAYRIKQFTDEEYYQYGNNIADGLQALNVPWRPLSPAAASLSLPITLNDKNHYGNSYGNHTVYLQVASHVVDNPSTPTLDHVGCIGRYRSVTVVLAPARLTTYVLTGADLREFIQRAKDRGYSFRESYEIRRASGHCGAGGMEVPPEGRPRISGTPSEITRARFEVFYGDALNPYWKLLSLDARHPNFPSAPRPPVGDPAVEVTEVVGNPPTGSHPIHRIITWERTVYPAMAYNPNNVIYIEFGIFDRQYRLGNNVNYQDTICVYRSTDGPSLNRLTLEGPSDQHPLDALPRVR